jgi:hypothetical protein
MSVSRRTGHRGGARAVAATQGAEFIKPGKGGAPHEKAESAFVQAMTRAKWPTHYLAVNSLSGKARALFLSEDSRCPLGRLPGYLWPGGRHLRRFQSDEIGG